MAKFVLVADPHASDRPPSSCTATYPQDILELLGSTVNLALTQNAVAIVIAGDLFHLKAPSRTSHRLVLAIAKLFREATCPVYVVPGNHDLQHDRLDSLQVTQPLGVLFGTGAVRWLDGRCYEFPQLYGVPWQQKWTDEAVGAALLDWRCDEYGSRDPVPGQNYLVVAHAPLYPPGKELKWEHYPAAAWAEAMGGRGSCFYGHVHEPHGTWETGGVQFCNNGALSRGSLHEYNLHRKVGATVWDSVTSVFTMHSLPQRPASEVFRLAEKAVVTDMQGKLDEFLAQVSQTSLGVVSTEQVMATVRAQELGSDVEDLVEELLEGATGS